MEKNKTRQLSGEPEPYNKYSVRIDPHTRLAMKKEDGSPELGELMKSGVSLTEREASTLNESWYMNFIFYKSAKQAEADEDERLEAEKQAKAEAEKEKKKLIGDAKEAGKKQAKAEAEKKFDNYEAEIKRLREENKKLSNK